MFKIYSMIAAAAVMAGALVVAPSMREVSASTRTELPPSFTGKGDRLDMAARRVWRTTLDVSLSQRTTECTS